MTKNFTNSLGFSGVLLVLVAFISFSCEQEDTISPTDPSSIQSPSSAIPTTGKTYFIKNRNSGLYMDIENKSNSNGANLQQWGSSSSTSDTHRQWEILSVSGSNVRLRGVDSGKCLENEGGGNSNGVNIEQRAWDGSIYQQWQILATSDGYYRIKSADSGKSIAVEGGGTTSGDNIEQRSWDGSNKFQWLFEEVGSDNNSGTCEANSPAGLSVDNISENSARLNWNLVSSDDHYNVRWRVVGTSTWSTRFSIRDTDQTTINNLSSNTDYEWQIRAKCSDGSGSSYSDASGTFRTTGGNDPEPPVGTGDLDPNKDPSENFNLSQWKLTISSGEDIDISVLNDGYTLSNQFYTDPSDGGMVFKNYPAGSGTGTTSGATQYSRVELRELLGGENSNVSETQLNENNWVFGSSGNDAKEDAGGVDGVLTATLKVDRVTTAADGSDTKVGRIVIGQIHASKNEPIRLYYKLMPGTTKGAIYFVHEDRSGNEFAVNMIGDYAKTGSNNAGDFSGAGEPSDGIPFGEVFSYKIEVVNNMLYVDIIRDGRSTVSEEYDMVDSDYEDDWMYFKAGLYSQNDQAESASDYEQVTFYSLGNTHD